MDTMYDTIGLVSKSADWQDWEPLHAVSARTAVLTRLERAEYGRSGSLGPRAQRRLFILQLLNSVTANINLYIRNKWASAQPSLS